MSKLEEVVAPTMDEIDALKFKISSKQVRSYNWKDDNGEAQSRRRPYAEVYYGKDAIKSSFSLSNVKTYKGVQISKKFKKATGFIVFNLTKEQSAVVKAKVDKAIFNLLFVNREALIKDGKKIKNPMEIFRMYKGVVKDGEEKENDPGKYWDDTIIATVPLVNDGPNIVPDLNEVVIEDLDGAPYAWTTLKNQELEEVVLEVERLDLEATEFNVRLTARVLTSKQKAKNPVTSRRRLQQQKKQGHSLPAVTSADMAMSTEGPVVTTEVGSKRKADDQTPATPSTPATTEDAVGSKNKRAKAE